MALPDGHKKRKEAEWLELANDTDPAKRRLVSSCLRDMGIAPTDYMGWSAEERVEAIMDAQGGDDGGEEEKEEKKSSSGKGKAGGKSKAGSSKKTKASSSSGGGADVSELKSTIDKMEQQIDDLQETQAELINLVRDAHFLVRVLVQSNKKLKDNSEDVDLQEVLYGSLVVEGNDD